MPSSRFFATGAGLTTVCALLLSFGLPVMAQPPEQEAWSAAALKDTPTKTPVEHGKAKAIELCQACHQFEGANQGGTVGPPLRAMTARFPDPATLRALIYDAQQASQPHTMMPPFGRHGLVDERDIEHIIAFLYTL